MVESMKKVGKTDQELTVEERNLLSVAYKNLIGARRASWRIITNIETKEETKAENSKMALIKKYRSQVSFINKTFKNRIVKRVHKPNKMCEKMIIGHDN